MTSSCGDKLEGEGVGRGHIRGAILVADPTPIAPVKTKRTLTARTPQMGDK